MPTGTQHDGGKRRILIVDDEPKICEMLTRYFSLKGYDARSVCSGAEAFALATAFQPHVVLLDLLMPGMTGVEVLQQFKQQPQSPRVIMLSAADHANVAEGALKLGADSYVCKPPDLTQLERLVNGFWPPTR